MEQAAADFRSSSRTREIRCTALLRHKQVGRQRPRINRLPLQWCTIFANERSEHGSRKRAPFCLRLNDPDPDGDIRDQPAVSWIGPQPVGKWPNIKQALPATQAQHALVCWSVLSPRRRSQTPAWMEEPTSRKGHSGPRT